MSQIEERAQLGKVIFTESDLRDRLIILARSISDDYENCQKVDVVVLLNGAKRFADDLFSLIDDEKFHLQYIRAKSYNGTQSNGSVTIEGRLSDIETADVLIVDDIYDSGRTMSHVIELINQHKPHRVKTCVLLEKQVERVEKVDVDFAAGRVQVCFIVGYGLDYEGQYRDLPFIAELTD